MDASIDFLAETFPHPVKPFLSTKHTLRHKFNALTKLNWDFAVVISIDINPGHVELFEPSS